MSIAVAVRKGNEIVLATDSQSNLGAHRELPPNCVIAKMVRIGAAVVASTGWSIYGNILDDYCRTHKQISLVSETAIFRFFMKFWKDLHKNYPFVNDQCQEEDDRNPFGDLDAEFLVVSPGGIFHVASNMSVTEYLRYHAIGSGCDYATGALYVLHEDAALDAETLARRAVEVANRYDIHCGGETRVEKIRVKGKGVH